MASHDPRIDAYIARSAEFAKPILEHIRTLIHEVCPQVEETIKWGMPVFEHAGGILCSMAAFKTHASFGFWKHSLVVGDTQEDREGMGSFGKWTSIDDLPPKRRLLAYLKKAVDLNERGVKPTGLRKAAPKPLPETPDDFVKALRGNADARRTFDAFAPSYRREYLEWILDAKREQTRARRIAQAVEWLAEGKSRNWKYENC
jgi:uncharacterized protein YdeI (YjbR/CyaY-like superfamily)